MTINKTKSIMNKRIPYHSLTVVTEVKPETIGILQLI